MLALVPVSFDRTTFLDRAKGVDFNFLIVKFIHVDQRLICSVIWADFVCTFGSDRDSRGSVRFLLRLRHDQAAV